VDNCPMDNACASPFWGVFAACFACSQPYQQVTTGVTVEDGRYTTAQLDRPGGGPTELHTSKALLPVDGQLPDATREGGGEWPRTWPSWCWRSSGSASWRRCSSSSPCCSASPSTTNTERPRHRWGLSTSAGGAPAELHVRSVHASLTISRTVLDLWKLFPQVRADLCHLMRARRTRITRA
jgi:hypothetical protein